MQARQNKDELLDILTKPAPFFFNGNREIIVKDRQFIESPKANPQKDKMEEELVFTDSEEEDKVLVWGANDAMKKMEENMRKAFLRKVGLY